MFFDIYSLSKFAENWQSKFSLVLLGFFPVSTMHIDKNDKIVKTPVQ
jgi:hypothetical protein